MKGFSSTGGLHGYTSQPLSISSVWRDYLFYYVAIPWFCITLEFYLLGLGAQAVEICGILKQRIPFRKLLVDKIIN